MNRMFSRVLSVVLLQCVLFFAVVPQVMAEPKALLNVKYAGEILKKITVKIDQQDSSMLHSSGILNQLLPILDQASDCVEQADDQLKNINLVIKSNGNANGEQLKGEDYKYLDEKRQWYQRQLSGCRYVVYRAKEILVNYKEIQQNYNQTKLLTADTPIWKAHLGGSPKINYQLLLRSTGIDHIEVSEYCIGAILLILAGFLSVYLRLICCKWLAARNGSNKPIYSAVTVARAYVIPVVILAVGALYSNVLFASILPVPSLEKILYAALVFVLLIAMSNLLVKLPIVYDKKLHIRSTLILTWLLFGYMVIALFAKQNLYGLIFDIIRSSYITVLCVGFVWMLFPLVNVFKSSAVLVKRIVSLVFFFLVLIEWFGYHQLVTYLISGFVKTVILALASFIVYRLVALFVSNLDNSNFQLSRFIRRTFHVKFHKKITEIIVLEYIAYFLILALFVFGVLHAWQLSGNHIDDYIAGLIDGFYIADLKLIPARIVIGLFCFAVISLFGRLIASIIAKKDQFEGEADTQVAISSIIIYVFSAVAILIMLLMIGVNFTGLAIIAGALSVGVGLGLQTIVNNFVSGVILLLEKPIKPGDRIVVGDTEGFVKKIRIRSTQIKTLAKEDVIFPNADLVTNKVTNYMFRDPHWRVVCPVGVAYGSDVERVKAVLLDVAANHREIMHEAPNLPLVLFRGFGESSLDFELWCVINDVNKKFVVISDLNFAIDAAFRANQITIAFPQRDVHIKTDA